MAKKVLEVVVDNAGVSINFPDSGMVGVEIDKLTPDIQRQCMLHGLKQKLADGAAAPKDTPMKDRYENVMKIAGHLLAGEWGRGRAESAGNEGGLLLRALIIAAGGKRPDEQIAERVSGFTAAEKRALLLRPDISAIVATIRPKSAIDTDALLGEII